MNEKENVEINTKIETDSESESGAALSQIYSNVKVTFETLKTTAKSKKMKDTLDEAERLAQFSIPILIIGETGVGKNWLTQAVHNKRKSLGKLSKKFCEITCTGIPETLFESELFGYKKGSHNTAYKDKDGMAKMADKGTLFLDEIGEISLLLQTKLLRLVEQKKFYPLGAIEEEKTDAHFIFGTNKSWEALSDPGVFRTDLLYRMGIPLCIPPLRERQEDIEALMIEFKNSCSKHIGVLPLEINDDAKERLIQYSWPGNIRELKYVMEYAVILAATASDTIKQIKPCHLPKWISKTKKQTQAEDVSMDTFETTHILPMQIKHILDVMDQEQGDREKAREKLGISEENMRLKFQSYLREGEDESLQSRIKQYYRPSKKGGKP